MSLHSLTDITHDLVEADLQRLFDNWGDGRDGWRVCAPSWLLSCGKPEPRQLLRCSNFEDYSAIPDVVWRQPEWIVMELKRSRKYEPLALAEVLHHAWHLGEQQRQEEGEFPVPVVLSSATDSAWMRAALRYLFGKGLHANAIRYLEGNYYQSVDGQKYAWFEEPFAMAELSAPPPVIPEDWESDGVVWRRMQTSETWIGLPQDIQRLPGMAHTEYAMVSSTDSHAECVVYSSSGDGSGAHIWRTESY
jgi:hypothetical protein